MADNEFAASVQKDHGLPVIRLRGDVNSFAETELNAAYAQATVANPSGVLLNFEDVTYMNSTGIALVVALLAQARKAHIQLLVCNLSEHYRHIFNITRLADFMHIHEDEASALAEVTAAAAEK
jgi:anti-sigma B factor antagonist